MAIFGSKTKTKKEVAAPAVKAVTKKVAAEKADKKAVAVVAPSTSTSVSTSSASIIIRPRITEKSGIMSQGGVYTFEVARGANKPSIAAAVKALYKVTPIKVTVINMSARKVFVRGKRGVQSGMRKAVVTLKKGDKIDFV